MGKMQVKAFLHFNCILVERGNFFPVIEFYSNCYALTKSVSLLWLVLLPAVRHMPYIFSSDEQLFGVKRAALVQITSNSSIRISGVQLK